MILRLALSAALLAHVAFTGCGGEAARDAAPGTDTAAVSDTVAQDSTAWVAHPGRVGVIRTGMPRTTLIEVVGQPTRFGYDARERCTYLGGSALPSGMQVMVFDSIVVRVDVLERGVPTVEGIQVGDREDAVLARYGDRAVVTPHPYSGPQWHYVTVTPRGDTLHRIVFETDGAVVKSYRVGRVPEVEWKEGCS